MRGKDLCGWARLARRMITFYISGPDARDTARALSEGLDELGAPPSSVVEEVSSEVTRDGVAVAALVLAIPPAILACWDLADRVSKLEAVKRWLASIKGGAKVVASDADGRSIAVDPANPAALLDLAGKSPPAPAWELFLAYAGPDRDLALELHGALERLGVRTFIDRRGLLAGMPWDSQLKNAQSTARGTVVLISSGFERAWYQAEEIQRAIHLARKWERLLIPLYRDGRPSDIDDVPYGLYRLEPLDLVSCGGVDGAAAALHELVRRSS